MDQPDSQPPRRLPAPWVRPHSKFRSAIALSAEGSGVYARPDLPAPEPWHTPTFLGSPLPGAGLLRPCGLSLAVVGSCEGSGIPLGRAHGGVMEPFTFLADYCANVTNHVIDEVVKRQAARREEARRVSIITLPRDSGDPYRVYRISNESGITIYRCIVEWRPSPADLPGRPFKRCGWGGTLAAGASTDVRCSVGDPDSRPVHLPESRVKFKIRGRWWMCTHDGEAHRVWSAPRDAYPIRRRPGQDNPKSRKSPG